LTFEIDIWPRHPCWSHDFQMMTYASHFSLIGPQIDVWIYVIRCVLWSTLRGYIICMVCYHLTMQLFVWPMHPHASCKILVWTYDDLISARADQFVMILVSLDASRSSLSIDISYVSWISVVFKLITRSY